MKNKESFDSISIELEAKNSSGKQSLHLIKQIYEGQKPEYFFTLTGDYEGEEIQVDFDETSRSELEDMRAMIDLILNA